MSRGKVAARETPHRHGRLQTIARLELNPPGSYVRIRSTYRKKERLALQVDHSINRSLVSVGSSGTVAYRHFAQHLICSMLTNNIVHRTLSTYSPGHFSSLVLHLRAHDAHPNSSPQIRSFVVRQCGLFPNRPRRITGWQPRIRAPSHLSVQFIRVLFTSCLYAASLHGSWPCRTSQREPLVCDTFATGKPCWYSYNV